MSHWMENRPNRATKCGTGALIAVTEPPAEPSLLEPEEYPAECPL